MSTFVQYHTHSDYSLLDSCTQFSDYVDLAIRDKCTAIASTEHGKPLGWVSKKLLCDKHGLKFIHGVEIYLTERLEPKVRDNYHTVLLAKNYDGVREINRLVGLSSDEDHFYYTNRITFDEFLNVSDNVIKTSACLASPLNKLPDDHPMYMRLAKHYDYLEVQPHSHPEQIEFNRRLMFLSESIGKPLIAGTDTHNSSRYKAECRAILLKRKKKSYGDEDRFDLTWKTYDELVGAFEKQGILPERIYLEAIENTNRMAESVEDFQIDRTIKYPILYGSRDADSQKFSDMVWRMFEDKISTSVIQESQKTAFDEAIKEEMRVFKKLQMDGFMLSMAEILVWCREQGMAIGTARGSVGGSRVAYVTGITDINPETWHTVFSRFCNEDREEIGDIDIDVVEDDRPAIFKYISERFGFEHTSRVGSYGTIADLGFMDDAGGALREMWSEKHPGDELKNPWSLKNIDRIKSEYSSNPDATKEKYPDMFYYYDGLVGTRVSQSVHSAGVVVSPLVLDEEYCVFSKDGERCLAVDMEELHEVGAAKYDFLVLKTVQVIRDTCRLIGKEYPKTHEVDWCDGAVWADMLTSPVGIFQMESAFAFDSLRKFSTASIFDMSLVTAAIRPSGSSYREKLLARIPNHNPSKIIDDLLSDNNGYLVYQCDVIKFLQQICGLSGSEADNVRRAIGRKDEQRLQAALPVIMEGYCGKSDKPRDQAAKEAEEFLRIIEDASSYMFGYNHSIAYCLLGYLCAYYRCYYPMEFIAASLNVFESNMDKVGALTEFAQERGVKITPPRFGYSRAQYTPDHVTKSIFKGVSSIKYMNAAIADELFEIAKQNPTTFMDALKLIAKSSVNSRQLEILIQLDFFERYGNAKELATIYGHFDFYKNGEMKTIKKEKIPSPEIEEIIARHATDKNAKGKPLKSYTITDMDGLLADAEAYVRGLQIEDYDIQTKIRQQNESLGYVDLTTNKEEDRRRLLISELHPLKSKNDGAIWGYAAFTRSIGSGKSSRLTVRANTYKLEPFRAGDIIYAKQVSKNKSGYWYLDSFQVEV